MSSPDQRVPELVGGVDIRTLPLTALDGFVLSRIDGRSSVSDIVSMTGLSAEQVLPILSKLAEAGAIKLAPPADAPSAPRRGSDPAPRTSKSGTNLPPISSTPPRRRPSYGNVPRRMMSESSISSPPPDMRSISQRPRANTPSRPRTPVPPMRDSQPTPARTPSSQAHTPVPPSSTITVPPAPSIPPGTRAPSNVTLQPITLPPTHAQPTAVSIPISLPQAPSAFDSDPPTNRLPIIENARDSDATQTGLLPPVISVIPERPPTIDPERPLYDPRELEEAVDLSPERRKQVLDMYYRLPLLNYYALLGLPERADKKDIRAAYFSLSKVFHPDSMFRKELGSFKAKMTSVFQALTEAYETLSKKKAREEYDRYLRSTRSARDAERAFAADEVAAADVQIEVPRPPPLPSTDYAIPVVTPSVPEPPREMSPEARRIARELLEKRLRGGRPQASDPKRASSPLPTVSSRPSGPAVPSSSPPMDRADLARQLGRTLLDVSKLTGSQDKVARAVTSARAAFERGEVAASVQHMARAFSLAPERVDLHQEYERLSKLLANKLAQEYEEQAKFEAKQNKWAASAASWAKVCEGRPEDANAHRSAAFALLKAGGDVRGAQKYAQQAVYLAPEDIDCRILLAQAYLTVGLKLNAKRELDAAARLDPSNEMVKNLLSDLKG